MKLTKLIPFALLAFTPLALGVPFDSNGTGGGVWADPATWTAGVGFPDTYAVPGAPGDLDANILTGDTVNTYQEIIPPTTPITSYAPTLVTPPPTPITAFADSIANPGVETDVASLGHGMITGESVTISGTTNYDGVHVVTVIDADNFTIPVVFVGDDATGSAQGPDDAVSPVTVTSNSHGLNNGDTVVISGATEPSYNGSFVVANVTANTFEITVTPVVGAPGDGNAQAPSYPGPSPSSIPGGAVGPGGFAIANGNIVTINGGVLTQAVYAHEMRVGEGSAGNGDGTLNVSGDGLLDTGSSIALVVGTTIDPFAGFGNGFMDIQSGTVLLGAGSAAGGFAVGVDMSNGAVNVGDGMISAPVAVVNYSGTLVTPPSSSITAFTDNGGVATDVASTGHGLSNGQLVAITGTTNYNGSHTVTVIDANNFTIPVVWVADDATGTAQGPDYGIAPVNVEATAHGLTTGQTVVISGYGGDPSYNGSHVVTVIDANNFTIPIVFVDNDATKGSAQTPSGVAILDLATNNVLTGIGAQVPGSPIPAGTGSVDVFSDGTINYGSANFNVGVDGGVGSLNVQSGGRINGGTGDLIIGNDPGSSGTFSSAGIVDVIGELYVGQGGGTVASATISGGSTSTGGLVVGRAGGSGAASITNAAVTLKDLGAPGNGGSIQSMVGDDAGSVGVLNIGTGGSLTNTSVEDFQVGHEGGTGTVNISGGGVMNTNWWLNIGRGAASTGSVTVSGSGSQLILDPTGTIPGGGPRINVGEDGGGATGSLLLEDNAYLQVGTNAYVGGNGGRELFVGRNPGSNGLLTVNSGAEIHANGDWAVIFGQQGSAVVNMDDGGKIYSNNWLIIANEPGSSGTLNINESNTGTTLVESGSSNPGHKEGRLIVGRLGNATVNQSAGVVRADEWFAIGIDPGGVGNYNFDGGKIENVHTDPGGRTIVVANRGTGTLSISVGDPTTTPGVISNGGIDAAFGGAINYFNVAGDSGGVGVLNINLANSTDIIQSREIYAGWSGDAGLLTSQTSGTINVNNGTLFTQGWSEIGRGGSNSGATGIVNINGPGSTWERGTLAGGYRADMNIGQGDGANRGEGFVNVTDGGVLNTNWWINLARNPQAKGHIVIDGVGSTVNMLNPSFEANRWDRNSQLNIGESGTGTLDITNGGVFNHMVTGNGIPNNTRDGLDGIAVNNGFGGGEVWIARNDGAVGTVNVDGAGSALNSFAREFRISNSNNFGTLNIFNGGVVNFNSHDEGGAMVNGNFGIAQNNAANATINMDGGQLNITAWSLFSAWEDNAGASVATINMVNSSLNLIKGIPGSEQGRLLWGRRGTATINQDGGSFFAADWAVLGVENGGRGYWNMSNGATAQLNHELNLGHGGPAAIGAVSIDASIMTVNGWTTMGRDGAGTGTLNVSNTGQFRHVIPNSGDMLVGWNNGIGNVNIDNGTVYQSWWTRFGLDPGSSGNMLIDNGGTFIGGLRVADGLSAVEKGGGHFRIGENGTGSVTVQNGSLLWHQGGEFRVATDNGVGTLNIDGSVVDFRSMNDDGTIAAGNFGLAENNGTATLNMTGGLLNVSGWSLFAGWNQVTSKATINMTDSIINLGAGSVPGGWGEGHLMFGDVGTFASGGGSTLNQEGGLIKANGWSAIGRERGGDALYNLGVNGGGGAMTVTGTNGPELYVGRQSHGTINMGPGTSITTGNVLNMAQETSPTTPSSGTINNDGGTVTVGGEFNVGRNGGPGNVAVYNQSAGLLTTNGEVFVGRDSTMGTLSLTGGTATLNATLQIGQGGGGSNGTVNLDGPATVMQVNGWISAMGRDTGGSPTTAALNISNGATLQHFATTGNSDFLGGWQAGTNATINVTDGGKIIYNWWFRLAVDPGSTTNMLVDGPGSSVSEDTGRIYIGEQGTASLTVSNGATFTQTNGDQFSVGGNDGSSTGNGAGVLNISDGTVSTNNFIRVGFGNTGADPAVGVVNLTSGSLTAGGWIGFGHEGGDGVLNMSGGAITFGNEFYVGIDDNGHVRTTTGTATISGGSITQTGPGAGLFVGRAGGNGLLDIVGTDPVAITILNETNIGRGGVGAGGNLTTGTVNIANDNASLETGSLFIGRDGGDGNVNLTNGLINNHGWSEIGASAGATGDLNISGPTAVYQHLENGGDMQVGYDTGTGVINVSAGGQFTANWWVNIARSPGSTGTVNVQDAGTVFTVGASGADARLNVGEDGTGVLNITNGGRVNALGVNEPIIVARNVGSTGTVNINTAGELQMHFLQIGAGVANVNLDDAKLIAGRNEGDYLRAMNPGNSEILAGGVKVDSNGFSITANNQFDGPGALTKEGTGTLRLTGDNLYAGGTTVTNGNLYVSNTVGSGTGPGDVTVTGASSVLGGVGTISGSVTASSSGSVAPGESTGVLSVGTNVTFSVASNFIVEIDDTATPKNDTLNVTGNLDVTGAALVLNITGAPLEPFYILATYGTLTGTFASATPPVDYVLDYAYGGNSIALVSTVADPFTTWIAGFPTGGLDAKLDDADGDGVVNLLEFALGGSDPTNPGAAPELVPGRETIGPDTYFTVSSLVRVGGAAGILGAGQPTNAVAIDDLRYTVEGSIDLTTWTHSMQPTGLNPIVTLPPYDPAPAGWEWATFRTTDPLPLTPPDDIAQGRIRVQSPF